MASSLRIFQKKRKFFKEIFFSDEEEKRTQKIQNLC